MSAVTTESLRGILLDTIEQVRAGKMEAKDAKVISDLATRIIDTADLELRYSESVSKLDRDGQGVSTGPLLLVKPD